MRAPNKEFYLSYTYQAMLDLNYKIGTYKLTSNEAFYPVGEPEDYFLYYNRYSCIHKQTLAHFVQTHKSPYYIANFYNKGVTITCNNELIIVVSGKIVGEENIFTTHLNKQITFEDDTYVIRFQNITGDYQPVNISEYIRGWLIGNFTPAIQRETDYEVGVLSHKKDEKWGFHYHSVATETNILVSGTMVINNITMRQGDVFIIDPNVIACPLFLTDCTVICIKTPSIPSDKYII
jgi:hypothetical protein